MHLHVAGPRPRPGRLARLTQPARVASSAARSTRSATSSGWVKRLLCEPPSRDVRTVGAVRADRASRSSQCVGTKASWTPAVTVTGTGRWRSALGRVVQPRLDHRDDPGAASVDLHRVDLVEAVVAVGERGGADQPMHATLLRGEGRPGEHEREVAAVRAQGQCRGQGRLPARRVTEHDHRAADRLGLDPAGRGHSAAWIVGRVAGAGSSRSPAGRARWRPARARRAPAPSAPCRRASPRPGRMTTRGVARERCPPRASDRTTRPCRLVNWRRTSDPTSRPVTRIPPS